MRDRPPALPIRAYRKLRGLILTSRFKRYTRQIGPDHPFRGFPTRIVSELSGDPKETLDHYDAFAYWAAAKISLQHKRLSILDIGSIKMMNAVLSATHDVVSLVLADCGDSISNVRYLIQDVSDGLPFRARSFDVFTSMASLNLVGLARYGDKLDAYALPHLVTELDRVLRRPSTVLISMCLGRNVLCFNNGWFLELETLRQVFHPWQLKDYLVDNASSPRRSAVATQRFVSDGDTRHSALGDYRVVFLHFER